LGIGGLATAVTVEGKLIYVPLASILHVSLFNTK